MRAELLVSEARRNRYATKHWRLVGRPDLEVGRAQHASNFQTFL